MTRGTRTRPRLLGGLLAMAVLVTACTELLQESERDAALQIATVPTPAHLVSGGNALVRVALPAGVDGGDARIALNGDDVTALFREEPVDRLGRDRRALLGLVDGLVLGDNTVSVTVGDQTGELVVTNYATGGPIFSGEQLDPYFCLEDLEPDPEGQPRRFAVGNGDFIVGGKLDDDCALETRVDYLYRTAGEEPTFAPLPDPAVRPADLAETTTNEGHTVPYVVRLETGTINRAIYQTAALVDPARPDPDPWAAQPGWNGRLVYTYGGGARPAFSRAPGPAVCCAITSCRRGTPSRPRP